MLPAVPSTPHYYEALRVASACFYELSPLQRHSGASVEETGTGKKRRNVLTTSSQQSGQDAEAIRKFISASKFCARSKFDVDNFTHPEDAESC